jgi:polysaccharide deacetylase family protein (PEP-CTERM system associated)
MKENTFTIDAEDWFQVFYGAKMIAPDHWASMDQKIDLMVDCTLELLESRNRVATFFVVGWIAEKNPNLIRRIVRAGHEIASHGYWHREVFRQTPAEFSEDIKRAKTCLEDASGQEIRGFRAPGYSIGRHEEWALDLLLDAGYKYDSSMLHAVEPCRRLENGLYEVAPNSLNFFGKRLPSNGGFFFRIMPYYMYKQYVRFLNFRNVPLVFYTHTWEIFYEYPRIEMSGKKTFIQYANLAKVKNKLDHLLQDFDFTSIEKAYPLI